MFWKREPRKIFQKQLRKLSATGRFCYLFLCIETYLLTRYPQKDWSPIAKRMWQWTEQYWSEGSDVYAVVVPEYLFEFDTYAQTNASFEGRLSENEYTELLQLFDGVTSGNPDDEINQVLQLPLDFCGLCEGCSYGQAMEWVQSVFDTLYDIFAMQNIPLPDINQIRKSPVYSKWEKWGWGGFENSEAFSIILNMQKDKSNTIV